MLRDGSTSSAGGRTSVTRKFMIRWFMSSLRTVTAARRLFQSSLEILRFCIQALTVSLESGSNEAMHGEVLRRESLQHLPLPSHEHLRRQHADLLCQQQRVPTSRGAMSVTSCRDCCQAAAISRQAGDSRTFRDSLHTAFYQSFSVGYSARRAALPLAWT